MRILALNWRDPKNPETGGAEIHLHEILKRTVAGGHEVTQISQAVTGLPLEEIIDGVRILRHGRRNTFNFTLKKFALSFDIASSFDLVIEDLCKILFGSDFREIISVLCKTSPTELRAAHLWFSRREITRIDLRVANMNETACGFWERMGFKPYMTTMYKREN